MPDRRVSRGVDDVDNFGSDLNHNKQQSSIGASFTMRCLAYSRQKHRDNKRNGSEVLPVSESEISSMERKSVFLAVVIHTNLLVY